MKWWILTALLCVSTNGCCANADKLTYEAVRPWAVKYLKADKTTDPDIIQGRLDTLETWRIRLELPPEADSDSE